MPSELDPTRVGERLAALRASYRAETIAEATERLQRERPPSTETFEERAARCLDELRALCELVAHLERAEFH